MADLLHSIAARLREWVGNRRSRVRCRSEGLRCHVSTCEALSLRKHARPVPSISGHTRDLSITGLSFSVPAIRIGGRYLAREDSVLRVIVELPTGSVETYAIATHYNRLGDNGGGYVIGAHITKMGDNDRERFLHYLHSHNSG